MGDTTGIQWTNATWNPLRGCSRVSPGCQHCYAERVAHRFSAPGQPYEGLVELVNGHPTWNGELRFVERHLEDPLGWREPRMIFVNSMSDLFHEKVEQEWLEEIWSVMELAIAMHGHTFQILTKRPDRMLRFFTHTKFGQAVAHQGIHPNIWLGVSAENAAMANLRVSTLLKVPAVTRWISVEPMLEEFIPPLAWNMCTHCDNEIITDNPTGFGFERAVYCRGCGFSYDLSRQINWVVVGGESGPGARPCQLNWIRRLVRHCDIQGIPVFVKQLGSRAMLNDDHQFQLRDAKGGDIKEWPEDLQVRKWPASCEVGV